MGITAKQATPGFLLSTLVVVGFHHDILVLYLTKGGWGMLEIAGVVSKMCKLKP